MRTSFRRVNSAWRWRIKDLERALGKKAMEIEILHAARDEVKKRPRYCGLPKR